MRFGAFTYGYSTNIGDEIQTIAASRFLPRIDTLVERDRLHWYAGGPITFVLFNGWFTHQPQWPPPDSIRPLLVSFHAALPGFTFKKEHAEYYRQFEPIGCRSIGCVEEFQKIGVNAYFSGCMTLTIEKRAQARGDKIYAVDVEDDLYARLVPDRVRRRAVSCSHEFPNRETPMAASAKWGGLHLALRALNKFSRQAPVPGTLRHNLSRLRHAARLKLADEALTRYNQARLVITSRLHCALPCLALGTPVVLLRRGVDEDPRFSGLRDLVRCYSESSETIKINWDNPEPNPDGYLRYANSLIERCTSAVASVVQRTQPLPGPATPPAPPAAERVGWESQPRGLASEIGLPAGRTTT